MSLTHDAMDFTLLETDPKRRLKAEAWYQESKDGIITTHFMVAARSLRRMAGGLDDGRRDCN